jgi:autotransporter-associated beta strand protein
MPFSRNNSRLCPLRLSSTGPGKEFLASVITRILPFLLLILSTQTSRAGSATWSTTPHSNDWNDEANWTPNVVPRSPGDIATFAESTQADVSYSSGRVEVDAIVFNLDANAYTITAHAQFMLELDGAGITNNSGVEQTFVSAIDDLGNHGRISFSNNASAGDSTIFINEGSAASTSVGGTFFSGYSTAGNAVIINHAGGGIAFLYGNSTAGHGTFTNNGSTDSGIEGGFTNFLDNSTAGNATFTSNGGTVDGAGGGGVDFQHDASAGEAVLIANGGSGGGAGGSISFNHTSLGGTAVIKLFGNGHLDISSHEAPGLIVGSIEGNGNVFLGDLNLSVGNNNLETTFSGLVQDGGFVGNVGGSLTKIGTAPLTLSGANTYTGGTEVKSGNLLVNNISGSGIGSGSVVVWNAAILGGNGTIQLGNGAILTNNGTIAPGGSPGQFNINGDIQLTYSSNLSFEIGGTTPATQYDVLNKTDAGALTLNGKLTVTLINGFTPQPSDTFTVVTTQTTLGRAFTNVKSGGRMNTVDGAGSFQVTYNGANNVTLSDFGAAIALSRSRNISARANVQTGDNVAIGGFVIKGTDPKKVIVRGIGPSLQNFGIQNPLSNPTLELHNQSGVIASNDDWKDSQQTEIQNSGFAPSNDLESAIVATLQPGSYSVILSGKNNATGVATIELYDLDPAANSKLANISTRALVGAGDDVLIGGVNVGPNNANSSVLLVRALGPSLQPFGVQNFLADPVLELHDAQGNLFALNDNWKDTQQTDITATHFAPSNDAESAIRVTLAPGAWTAVVRGAGDTSGVALVEVYKF